MRVIHTRLLFWADGFTMSPGVVLIHPRARGDASLLAHEAVHAEQMRQAGTVAWWWCYLTSRAFRQKAEVAAYRVQLQHSPHSALAFARYLSTRYWLNLTEAQALVLITEPAV